MADCNVTKTVAETGSLRVICVADRASQLLSCAGSECSVQISNSAPVTTPDFNANMFCDDCPSTTRVTRGVQTLPRSAHNSRVSSTYHAGGSLTRPASTPRPAIVDKQVCALVLTLFFSVLCKDENFTVIPWHMKSDKLSSTANICKSPHRGSRDCKNS